MATIIGALLMAEAIPALIAIVYTSARIGEGISYDYEPTIQRFVLLFLKVFLSFQIFFFALPLVFFFAYYQWLQVIGCIITIAIILAIVGWLDEQESHWV